MSSSSSCAPWAKLFFEYLGLILSVVQLEDQLFEGGMTPCGFPWPATTIEVWIACLIIVRAPEKELPTTTLN